MHQVALIVIVILSLPDSKCLQQWKHDRFDAVHVDGCSVVYCARLICILENIASSRKKESQLARSFIGSRKDNLGKELHPVVPVGLICASVHDLD